MPVVSYRSHLMCMALPFVTPPNGRKTVETPEVGTNQRHRWMDPTGVETHRRCEKCHTVEDDCAVLIRSSSNLKECLRAWSRDEIGRSNFCVLNAADHTSGRPAQRFEKAFSIAVAAKGILGTEDHDSAERSRSACVSSR